MAGQVCFFGLLNAFVRPLILFLTGNLIIAYMVLVVLLSNTILMWLLEVFTDFFVVDNILWLIAGGTLMAATVFILESIFGLDSPTLEDRVDKMPFYWRWLASVPTGRRNRIIENMRLRRVYNTLWQYGIDIALDQTSLRGMGFNDRPIQIEVLRPPMTSGVKQKDWLTCEWVRCGDVRTFIEITTQAA